MNAMPFAAAVLFAGALALPAQVTPSYLSHRTSPLDLTPVATGEPIRLVEPNVTSQREPNASVEAILLVSEPLRAIVLEGDPGRPFAIFLGPELAPSEPIPGVPLQIEVNVLFRIGTLDPTGHAYVPVDPQARYLGLDRLYFQAVLWPVGAPGKMPDQITEPCELVFQPFQTEVPDGMQSDSPWVVCLSPGVRTAAELVEYDAIAPQVGILLTVTVPTGGYVLRADAVLHAGEFTRVVTTLERPAEGEIVVEMLHDLEVLVPVGIWVGMVEVVVNDLQRLPTTSKPAPTAPTGN